MKKYLIPVLFYLSLFPIIAESIILDDGKIIKRSILKMDLGHIYLKTDNDSEEKISNENVIRILYKDIDQEDLSEILTDEEKKKIEEKKEKKKREVENLKKEKLNEISRKKEISEKKTLEEKKLRKIKKKDDLVNSLSEKDAIIKNLEEEKIQSENRIAELDEQLLKLQEELDEANALIVSLKNKLKISNSELASIKKENKELKNTIVKQKDGAVWKVVGRSAVVPSWGHFYLKQNTTGKIYAGLFFGSFLFTIRNYLEVNSAKKAYNNTIFLPTQQGIAIGYFLAQEKYSIYAQNQQKLKQSFSILSLVYIIQLTHAYFSGKAIPVELPAKSIGFRAVDSVYSSGNSLTQNRHYELYYQFNF